MKVAVTGSKGFLAENLIRTLNSRNENIEIVFGINRRLGYTPESVQTKGKKFVQIHSELDNEASVKDVFRCIKPDIIFHVAASQKNTPEAYRQNTSITNNILKYTPEGVRFVYVSSSTVYGNLAQNLHGSVCDPEQKCEEWYRLEPTSLYGASKVADEALIGVYDLARKIDAVILRPCAIVGIGATHGALQDIIRKANEPGDELELWGDEPGAIKPYVHVNDVVEALIHFGFSEYYGAYNICPEDSISIDKLADIVMETLGVSKKKVWVGAKSPSGDNPLVTMSDFLALEDGWKRKYNTSNEAIVAVTTEWKRLNG